MYEEYLLWAPHFIQPMNKTFGIGYAVVNTAVTPHIYCTYTFTSLCMEIKLSSHFQGI